MERKMRSNVKLIEGFRLWNRRGGLQIFVFVFPLLILFKDRLIKLILVLVVFNFLVGIIEYNMELHRRSAVSI
jgi:hypothetical protein